MAGCATTTTSNNSSPGTTAKAAALTLGTTDKVVSLDPAGSYDNGSFFIMNQIYPFLFNTAGGATDMTPQPDLAASIGTFTSPTTYEVKLKPGLKFSNGHELTSSDVKFSFDRITKINADLGPASLLTDTLVKTDAPDATTVVFTLKNANDVTFSQVLESPAAPIVDEQVFPADKVLSDEEIAKSNAFAGQYTITGYTANQLISLTPNASYQGMLGAGKSAVNIKYYADSNNLKLDIQQGNIDVAHRSLTATDIESLKKEGKVNIVDGPGGELRYLVFNLDTMPYGAKDKTPDAAKALAIRQAVAHSIDRQAISDNVFKGTYTPLFGFVPDGQAGAGTVLKSMFGDGSGKPDAAKAKAVLTAAGVTTPVTLNIQYTSDHYGPSSGDEYAAIKSQLEATGLFTVNIQSTEWKQYSTDRRKDMYPEYQLGWFPDFSDPDNFLTPFFGSNSFIGQHYKNDTVLALLAKETTTADKTARVAVIDELQKTLAGDLPIVPMQQGKQIAVAAKNVSGVQLDPSFKLRVGSITKS